MSGRSDSSAGATISFCTRTFADKRVCMLEDALDGLVAVVAKRGLEKKATRAMRSSVSQVLRHPKASQSECSSAATHLLDGLALKKVTVDFGALVLRVYHRGHQRTRKYGDKRAILKNQRPTLFTTHLAGRKAAAAQELRRIVPRRFGGVAGDGEVRCLALDASALGHNNLGQGEEGAAEFATR